jgi:hypothetical protein
MQGRPPVEPKNVQDKRGHLEVREFFSQLDRFIGSGSLIPRNQVNRWDGKKSLGQTHDQ